MIRRLGLCALIFISTTVHANSLWNWFKQYRLGVDYTNSADQVDLSYTTDRAGKIPDSCVTDGVGNTEMRCTATIASGSSSGFGFFLQRAFKREGNWYFSPEMKFAIRYLNGNLVDRYSGLDGLPLRQARFSLGAFILKPTIKLGFTPNSAFPDLFISFGPAVQVAMGVVEINNQPEKMIMGNASGSTLGGLLYGFIELEAVLARFGDGAFSLFTTKDFSSANDGTLFYPHGVNSMSDFKGAFTHQVGGMAFGLGLKLLLSWP